MKSMPTCKRCGEPIIGRKNRFYCDKCKEELGTFYKETYNKLYCYSNKLRKDFTEHKKVIGARVEKLEKKVVELEKDFDRR